MTKRRTEVARACVECGATFTVNGAQNRRVTCSPPCQRERTLRRTRDWAAARYTPADPHPPATCEECGRSYVPYRLAQARFCSRACQETNRCRRRSEEMQLGRQCSRCGATVPRQPGPPVCQDCKIDKRDRRAYERLRTMRRYGLTEESYQALFAAQGGHCGICDSAEWGVKGPQIDHCHETGEVRWLLCALCNSGLGMFRHDPTLLRQAADRLEEQRARSTLLRSKRP